MSFWVPQTQLSVKYMLLLLLKTDPLVKWAAGLFFQSNYLPDIASSRSMRKPEPTQGKKW